MAPRDVYRLVRETEMQLSPYYDKLWQLDWQLDSAVVLQKVKNQVAFDCSFGHNCSEDFLRSHKLLLVHNIALYYIKIKMYSISKTISSQLCMSVRNEMKKTVNFQNLRVWLRLIHIIFIDFLLQNIWWLKFVITFHLYDFLLISCCKIFDDWLLRFTNTIFC